MNIKQDIERWGHRALVLTWGVGVLLLGFSFNNLSLRWLAYSALAAAALVLALSPISLSVQILTLYIGVEGFAKLMTNYNPMIHVGSDLLILTLWFRTALKLLVERQTLPKVFPPFTWLFLAHWIWFLITVLNPYSLGLIPSLAGAKLYVTIFSLYFFGFYLSDSPRQIRFFMITWVIVCVLQVITALYQASIGPESVLHLSPAYGIALKKFQGYAFRPFGLTNQPGAPAIYVHIVAPFILYFLFHSRYAFIALPLIALFPAAILTEFVCQIRSSLLKTILGASIYIGMTFAWLKTFPKRTQQIIVPFFIFSGVVAFAATPFFLQRLLTSNVDNQRAVERSLSLFDVQKVSKARSGTTARLLDYAFRVPLGAGLSRIGSAAGKFENVIKENPFFRLNGFFSDNLWIEMLVDLGIPGVLLVSMLLVFILYRGWTSLLVIKDPELKAIQGAIFTSLLVILFGGYGAEPILYNPEGPFFWFFSGVMIRISMGNVSDSQSELKL